jgi:hypothetical protein
MKKEFKFGSRLWCLFWGHKVFKTVETSLMTITTGKHGNKYEVDICQRCSCLVAMYDYIF